MNLNFEIALLLGKIFREIISQFFQYDLKMNTLISRNFYKYMISVIFPCCVDGMCLQNVV